MNYGESNITSLDTQNLTTGRKNLEDPFGPDSLFGLPLSHKFDDPRLSLNYGGTRKVKDNQVEDSVNVVPTTLGHAFLVGDITSLAVSHSYSKPDDDTISTGLTYDKGEGNILLVNSTYSREVDNFIYMGQAFRKEDNISTSYKGSYSTLSRGHTFSKGNSNLISAGQPYCKEDGNSISVGHSHDKGNNNSVLTRQISDSDDETTISLGHFHGYKGEHSDLSIGHLYTKEDANMISFGGSNEDSNPSRILKCSYELLVGQASVQRPEAEKGKSCTQSDGNVVVTVNPAQKVSSSSETLSNKKDETKVAKKDPQNSFPSNVRSLLSTCMLDGVPVKYIAWSQENPFWLQLVSFSGYMDGMMEKDHKSIPVQSR